MRIDELKNMNVELYEQRLGLGANHMTSYMGNRDQKKDFQDKMIQLSVLRQGILRKSLTKQLKDQERRVNEEDEELRNMNADQLRQRDLLLKKQHKYYSHYLDSVKKQRQKRNSLVETLMATGSYHNRAQRDLALLCTKYDIVPDKELAMKNYSDSMAKANQIVDGSLFNYYKTGQMFDIAKGVTLNKELKK